MAFEVRHFSPLIQRWRRCSSISTALAAGVPNGWARHWTQSTMRFCGGAKKDARS